MLDACEKREVQQNLVSPTMIGVGWQRLFIKLKRQKVYQRVQAVLLIAQGYSVDEVVRITRSQQRSVYYWMHRYLDHHRVADLYDASRTGRPRAAAQITKACILRELAR